MGQMGMGMELFPHHCHHRLSDPLPWPTFAPPSSSSRYCSRRSSAQETSHQFRHSVVKLMIPFALISANLGILNKRLGVAPSALFMLVMAISDFLTLHFFWVVKDEGSWLEIGSTISHFVIASLLCMFVASLEGVSEIFIAGVEVEDGSAQLVKEKELGGVELVSDNSSGVSGKSNGVSVRVSTNGGLSPRKPVANGVKD